MSKPYDTAITIHVQDTTYHLEPNPDTEPGAGFSYGAVLSWSDPGDGEKSGHFFIAPEAFPAFAEAFNDIVEGKL